MIKKGLTPVILAIVVLAIAACSSLNLGGSTSNSAQNQQNPAMNFKNQPVESKLALGTFALEGTSNAVTAAQAKALLPLWKAVKSLGSSTTATTDEMNALYKQIEEAMTAEQVQAIKDLDPTQAEMQAIFQKAGVQMPQGPQGAPRQNGTPSANGAASSGSQGGFAGGPGGLPPDAGGGPGGPGGFPGGQTGGSNSAVKGTPQTGQTGPRPGGMNVMLADTLITLLQTRVGG